MIVKMKKYNFLVFHKDHESFMLKLRDLGVVHIVKKEKENLQEKNELYNWVNYRKQLHDTVRFLKNFNAENNITELKPADYKTEGIENLRDIEHIIAERNDLKQQINNVKKEHDRLKPWGHFNLDNINKLEKEGLFIHFHSVPKSKFNPQWVEEYNATEISQSSSFLYFITITKSKHFPDIDTEHIRTFETSLDNLDIILSDLNLKFQNITERLKDLSVNHYNTLINHTENYVQDKIDWEKVILNSEPFADDKILFLEGFVPVEKVETVNNELSKEDIYFDVSDVKEEEKAPVMLKNNKFARSFEFISNVYDSPSYHSFDMTMLYAPFYVIFFGLCVGDCGYGLLYILISLLLSKAKEPFLKSVSNLILWLGIGTVVCGFISGSFFGIPLANQSWSWLDNFKGIIIDSNQAFFLALILGGIQLVYAMIVKAVTSWIRYGVFKAMDTIGWLIFLLGNGAVIMLSDQNMITPENQSFFHKIFIYSGLFIMLFFNNTEKGLKGIPASIGGGIWGLYNKLSSLLSDMLSYIRLFALGISGAVLGLVFNELAFSFAPDLIILKQLVVIIILVFGHTINLLLCSLGGFVHPMRLTFVEFYKNAGFEGGGKVYKPFKKNVNN